MTLNLVTKSPAQAGAWRLDLPVFGRWVPIPLRLIVGYGFIMHGYAKFSRGPDNFAVVLHTIGVPFPHLMAWLTCLTELIGGFAVLIGAFVPLVSLPMMVVLLTALFTIHLRYGFFSVNLVEVTATGQNLARSDMKLSCSIYRAWSRLHSAARVRFQSINGGPDASFRASPFKNTFTHTLFCRDGLTRPQCATPTTGFVLKRCDQTPQFSRRSAP